MPQPINRENNNTPEAYDEKFNGTLGVWDMERHYKLTKYFKKGVYIDVGCFDSIMPILLAERPGNDVHAIDHSPKLIEFLRGRFPKVNYIVADAMKLPYPDEYADYICAGETIEHLPDPAGFVKEAMRVLKKGGYLSISTPFEERGSEVGGPYHMWRWTKKDVEELLNTKETEIIEEGSSMKFKTILAWKRKE